jgi:hypothetical protein
MIIGKSLNMHVKLSIVGKVFDTLSNKDFNSIFYLDKKLKLK